MRSLITNSRALCALTLTLAFGCDAESSFQDPVGVSLDSDGSQSTLVDGGPAFVGADAAVPLTDFGLEQADAGQPRQYKGAIVINNDYTSVSVSVVDTEAKVLSEMFISAASADPKLTKPLSSDLVLPNSDVFGDEVVLIDRSNSVITWVELESAQVRAQLDVGPGFDANPHDYAQVAANKAYVSRFADNGDPGNEEFDSGLDLLVIDPSKPEIVGSVDLRPAMEAGEPLPATPDRMIYAGGRIHVMISGLASDFSDIAEARLVSVDVQTDEIVQVLKLDGMRNCTDVKLSPNRLTLAVACTGFFGQDPADGWPDAGVVLVDIGDELEESARFSADSFQHCADGICQNTQINGLSFAKNGLLMVTTFGITDLYGATATELSLETNETRMLLEGGPFDVGGPACFAGGCLVPSAAPSGPGLLKFDVEDRAFDPGKLKPVDQSTGLPPRHIQRF